MSPPLRQALSLAALAGAGLATMPAHADETLVVETTCAPGKVFVDGKEAGQSPARVSASAGPHKVRAELENGDVVERMAFVNAGGATLSVVPATPAICRPVARRGLSMGVGGGAGPLTPWVIDTQAGKATASGLVAFHGSFLVNYGAHRVVDLRTGLDALVSVHPHGTIGFVGVPAQVRLNLGSTYTLGVGVAAGLAFTAGDLSYKAFAVGPTLSPLGFRFGARGQWELSLFDARVAYCAGGAFPGLLVSWAVSLNHLFLGADPGSSPPKATPR
jgi:hypothetical protein